MRRFDDAGPHEIATLAAPEEITGAIGFAGTYYAEVSANGRGSLLASDGTIPGTRRVYAGPGLSTSIGRGGNQAGLLHFGNAFTGEMFRTDGTIEGTFPIGVGSASSIGGLGDHVAWQEIAPRSQNVWSSDGTRKPPVLLYSNP